MRYLLNNDDDGHWYLIPADRSEEFDGWVYGEDEYAPQPDWAYSLGSHPNSVTFESPEHFGEKVAS